MSGAQKELRHKPKGDGSSWVERALRSILSRSMSFTLTEAVAQQPHAGSSRAARAITSSTLNSASAPRSTEKHTQLVS